MKRFFLCFVLLFGCVSAISVSADDRVRAAQERLREEGFYFGKTDGLANSETATAVTRYQIRRGLQITGRLDGETEKALGIAASASAEPAPIKPEAATWRKLRRSDERFLKRLNAGKIPPPAAPAAAEETATEGPTRLVLSRERLRDYVAAFVLAGLSNDVDAELEFFGRRVAYFNEGTVSRGKIRGGLVKYNRRWPERSFRLAGEVTVEPRADSRLRVTFPLRYELRNGRQRAAGQVRKTLLVEVVGDELEIVGVDERKI